MQHFFRVSEDSVCFSIPQALDHVINSSRREAPGLCTRHMKLMNHSKQMSWAFKIGVSRMFPSRGGGELLKKHEEKGDTRGPRVPVVNAQEILKERCGGGP